MIYTVNRRLAEVHTALFIDMTSFLSPSGPGFDPPSDQFSWLKIFLGFFLNCKMNVWKNLGPIHPWISMIIIIIKNHVITGVNDL